MSHRPALRSRVFAIVTTIPVLPSEFRGLFEGPSAHDAVRFAVDTIAVIGLLGYAFQRPMGPQLVWRVFAPIFTLFIGMLVGFAIPPMVAVPNGRPMATPAIVAALLTVTAVPVFMSLALFRHGGWFRVRSGKPDYGAIFS